MRIGMDARCLHSRMGGVTTYIDCLAGSFAEMGHEVFMISNHPLPKYDSNPRTIIFRKKIGPLKIGRFWETTLLPIAARRMGIDVLHFPADPVPPGLRLCPHVATIHDLYAYAIPELFESRQSDRLRRQFKEEARKCDAVITVSEQSKGDIIRFLAIPEDKITVIPQAGRPGVYRLRDKAELVEARRTMGLPERFVLCVGGKNNRYHKNTHRVVEALALLDDRSLRDVEIVFVGVASPYQDDTRRIVCESGLSDRVKFTGLVDERTLCLLYNLASVFAFPSLYEGFGLPILEAMACGTPVITSDYGAMKEVAGDAAILIDPNEPAEMADAIRMLLTDSSCHNDYSSRGFSRASSFTWEKTAAKTLDVFTRVRG